MAYNNGFPMGYNYFQQPMMPQQMFTPQPVQQQQMQQPTPQQQYPVTQSGFVRVRNENEARLYTVAPGNSVTFIDESAPYVYTKTVNIGQLDRPIFEKYRLVQEDDVQQPVEAPYKGADTGAMDLSKYALQADVAAVRGELDAMRADIETFRGDLYGIAGKKKPVGKKEAVPDE